MKNKIYFGLLAIFSVLVFTRCGEPTDEKFISEGIIEYDAAVVDMSNPMANMAPTKMSLKFKEDKCLLEMSAGMGLFSTSFISNPEEQSLTQLVKLLNKKFALVQKPEGIKAENEGYPLELIPTNETKVIAGYTCTKVHVKVKNDAADEFDVYYTKDLNIKNPNFANPYSSIDGVLMEYQMKKFGLEMRFTAKAVMKKEIDDESFKLNKDYKLISQEEMDELFLGIL